MGVELSIKGITFPSKSNTHISNDRDIPWYKLSDFETMKAIVLLCLLVLAATVAAAQVGKKSIILDELFPLKYQKSRKTFQFINKQ